MRRILILGGIALVLLGAVNFLVKHRDLATKQQPVDFQINWVAAHRLVHHQDLYDREASKRDGLELVGPVFDDTNGGTYSSFIGSPATALRYVPFTPFSAPVAADLFRATQAGLLCAAVAITGFALPRRSRVVGWLAGAAALLWFYPVAESLGLGQVDGYVTVLLALAVYASVRDRWRVVGVALGLAAVLKISPGLLLVYLVLRKRRTVVLPAVASAAGLLGVAALVGRVQDMETWVTDVLPKLAKGGLLVNNQSLPAWCARLFGSRTDWLALGSSLGAWGLLAPVVAVGGLLLVWWTRRGHSFVPLELGAMILVAVLAGPIAWDHYPTWAVVTVVLLADVAWWETRRVAETAVLFAGLGVGLFLMRTWTLYPTAREVSEDWTRRVVAGSKTAGLVCFLAVSVWLLRRPVGSAATDEPSPSPAELTPSPAELTPPGP